MSGTLATAAALAVALAFIAAIAQAIRENGRNKELAAARQERARQLRWQYEDSADGYRIQGVTHGIPWEIGPAPHAGEDRKILWRTAAVPARRAELAIVGRFVDRLMSGVAGKIILRLADQKNDQLQEARELYGLPERAEVGTEEFRRRFAVRVHDARVARQAIDRTVERLLLQWPAEDQFLPEAQLGIRLNPRGLEIECGRELKTPAALEQLVELGCALAHNLRAA